MTTGSDALTDFTGTAKNDTFTAPFITAGAGDTLDGGAGTDSLTIETSTALTDTFVTSNIENVEITGLGAVSVNMKNMADVESITNNASTGTLTLTNIAANAALNANGNARLTSAAFTSAALQGASDGLVVNLDGTTNASVTVNAGFESAKVNSVSDSALTGFTVPGVTTFIAEGKGLTVSDNVLDSFTTIILKNDGDVALGADTEVALLSALDVTGDIKAQTIDTTTDTQGRAQADDTLTLATTGGTVLTSAGDDTLHIVAGTSGTDTIRLGAGNDNLVYEYGNGTSVVDMGAGDDLLFVNTATAGTATSDTIDLGDGTDTVVILDTTTSTAKLQNAENVSVVVKTGSNTVNLDGSSAVALTIESATADKDITVSNLTSGTTVQTINNNAANPIATGDVTVGFKAAEAASTITFNNKFGVTAKNNTLDVKKVGDLTLDFKDSVNIGGTGIDAEDSTSLAITAAKDFTMTDIASANGKTTDITVTGQDAVTINDITSTSLTNVKIAGEKAVDIGKTQAATMASLATVDYSSNTETLDYDEIGKGNVTTDITSVKLSANGNLGANTQGAITAKAIGTIDATSTTGTLDLGAIGDAHLTTLDSVTLTAKGAVAASTIDSAKIGSITATSSDASVELGAINDTADGDMGTITATAKSSVTLGAIGKANTADKLTSLTATSTDGAVTLATAGITATDADGFDVTLSAATTIDKDGSHGATTILNNDGDIGTIKLSGAATAVVNATVADSGTNGGYYVHTVDASGLTGGLTSTITNDEDLASVASTTTVLLGAASSATNNTITFAGDVDTISVTGSAGNDTIDFDAAGAHVDSATISLTGTGTDTLDLTNLNGKVADDNGMVINLSSADVAVGTSSLASGKIAELDGTNLASSGVSLTVNGIDAIVGTDTANTIYAAGTGTDIKGGDKADTIIGGTGDDTITGGTGDDTITTGGGTDAITLVKTENDVVNVDAGTANISDGGLNQVFNVSAGAIANIAVAADYTATSDTKSVGTATTTLTLDDGKKADLSAATVDNAATDGFIITASGNTLASTITGSDAADIIIGTASVVETIVFADTATNNGADTIDVFAATEDILNFDAFVDITGVEYADGSDTLATATDAAMVNGVGADDTADIAGKVVLMDKDAFDAGSGTVIEAIQAGISEATGSDQLALADNAKAVVIYGDIDNTGSNQDLSVYYVEADGTADNDTETVTLVGTVTVDDIDGMYGSQFIVA